MTKKTRHLGNESGKSSNKWFGRRGHPKGYGASAGDGRTTDSSVAGKIVPVFKKAKATPKTKPKWPWYK
jgi:hypothetical protein